MTKKEDMAGDSDFMEFVKFVEHTAAEVRDAYWRSIGKPRKPWVAASEESKQAWRESVMIVVTKFGQFATEQDAKRDLPDVQPSS